MVHASYNNRLTPLLLLRTKSVRQLLSVSPSGSTRIFIKRAYQTPPHKTCTFQSTLRTWPPLASPYNLQRKYNLFEKMNLQLNCQAHSLFCLPKVYGLRKSALNSERLLGSITHTIY